MLAEVQIRPTERTKAPSLSVPIGIAFAALAALIFILNTPQGIGILPDSTRYMLYGPEGFDAPLYSWLLSAVTLVTGNMSRSAWIIGLPLACANAWLIWRLLSQSAGPATAGIGAALILLSPHFVGLHSVAMSEPLYLAGTFLSVLIFLKYAATGKREWLVACGAVLGLTMIARFTTVPLIATLCIFVLLETGRAAGERMRNVLLLGVPASLPFIVWAVAAKLTTGRATGRSLELNGNMNAERWQSGLEILSAYLLPVAVPAALRYALLFAVIAAILWLWQGAVRRVVQAPALAVSAATGNLLPAISGAFALLYLGFLILSVSVEANLYLNGRYWLPFYVALVLAATPLAARLRRSHGIQHHIATAAAVLALLLVGAHALRTVHLTGENRHGRGYAEMAWRYSPTVAAVRKLPPNAVIFSNGPDAINYLTGRHTRFIPFLFQRRTGRDDPANPYRRQLADMAKHVHRGHGYVIFLDRIPGRFYLPAEADLRRQLNLVLVKQFPDGRIYRSFLYPPAPIN